MTSRTFAHFLDIPVAATRAEAAVDWVLSAPTEHPTTFRLVNAGTIEAAHRSRDYWELLKGEGVNLPDGRPLTKVLSHTTASGGHCEQVRGPSLFEHCLDRGRERKTKHFLLGSSEATLELLVSRIGAQFPGAIVAGTYSPPFGNRTRAEVESQDDVVRRSGADIIWVALGTPRQDREALRIYRATGLTTAAVGAAFDFTAGTKQPAPGWMHRLHLEWLFRLASEPRRLGRRYLVGNSVFLALVGRHLLGQRHRR